MLEIPIPLQGNFTNLINRLNMMKQHPIFFSINSIEDLRAFMEWHVFAVWDFMSLVKRLQMDLTCSKLPWIPPFNSKAARLINEIVLAEETDENFNNGYTSHYELYLSAMQEVGADTTLIAQFVDLVRNGTSVDLAMEELNIPHPIKKFVVSTMRSIYDSDLSEVLGSFFYGREDPIPAMFRNLLDHLTLRTNDFPKLIYYLNRHVQLDSENHGPAAQIMISEILGNDNEAWSKMLRSAESAVNERILLWDSLLIRLCS